MGAVAENCNVSQEPDYVDGWRGKCNIPGQKTDIDIAACLPKDVSSIVPNLATTMPDLLSLEKFPRADVCPAYFTCLPPTEFSIDLVFFSNGRDEKILDELLNDAICSDLALKADVGTAELLIFTSLQLPEKLHRFKGKFYFWGLFLPKLENDALHTQKDERMTSLSSHPDGQGSFEGETSSIKNSVKHSPLIQTNQARKRTTRLDDAWKHAEQVDGGLRVKAKCKYCGFVSEYGGISRLKAHLAGGSPKSDLPGCPKVSPDVKQVMAIWYHEWVKTAETFWLKEDEEETQHPQGRKKGRPLDDAWKHAKVLDDVRVRRILKCIYCGFISMTGGIARLKAHLSGGSPISDLPGCDKVSPEIKQDMAKWFHEWVKNTNVRWVKENQAPPTKLSKRARELENAVELDEKRQHCEILSKGATTISNLHSGGDDPSTPLKGCSNVSKSLISEDCVKKEIHEKKFLESEGTIETNQESVRKLSNNTGLKETLLELIGEKKANLAKEQSNLCKLEKHLALITKK